MTKIRQKFSKNLRKLRKDKGLTQETLAEKLEISVRYVQKLEGKDCPNVGIDTLEKIAKVLKCQASRFL